MAACFLLLLTPLGSAGQEGGPALASGFFVALRVSDLDAAADWYTRVFDLREANRLDADDLSIRVLAGHEIVVELIHQVGDTRPESRHIGLFKAGFIVEDIDAFFARMRERGVDTDRQIFVDGALQMRSFLMRDPEGNRLQAFQRCSAACR